MEISALEINLLTSRISRAIADYFVSGVYSIEGGVLLRFNHATMPEKIVAVSSFAAWLTTKNLSLPQATKFVSRLRARIERSKIVSLEQLGNERIVRFVFQNRKGERMNFYAEFFSRGNLVLTDPLASDLILDVERAETFRHRKVIPGERYELPPARGVALQVIDEETLISMYNDSVRSGAIGLSAIKWFGRTVGTSRKFVEEIFERSGLDPGNTLSSLNEKSLARLAKSCNELLTELSKSAEGHILMPSEDSDIDPDVCPIVPASWNAAVERKLGTISTYPSLSEALDEVQIKAIVLAKRRKASTEARTKSEELNSAITKQKSQMELNEKISKELRELARSLMHISDGKIDIHTIEILTAYNLLEFQPESPNQQRFASEPRSYLSSFTSSSLASRLYDEAKRLEEENRKIQHIMEQLEDQRKVLLEQTKSQEDRASRKMITDRRERQWYERYRWFVLSDGRLIIGGRDATSNSIIINKYTEANDVVFHADLHGSPFFVLRNRGERRAPADEITLELAQATVSFSRAWKDELGSADAYWVFGDQVKKSAPSGEYLPRGSFFIEGKKNLVRHVRVELAIGMAGLPSGQSPQNEVSNHMTVVCGPDTSIARHCVSKLRLVPGKEKSSAFARLVKQKLIAGVKDPETKEIAKRLSIDEIIRVLPSGGYKSVS